MLGATSVQAQVDFDTGTPFALDPPRSPQRFALDIKLGTFSPSIDQSLGLQGMTPFSDLFGGPGDPKGAQPSPSLSGQVELDYQFSHRGGTWGVGLGLGFVRKSAAAFATSGGFCSVVGEAGGARSYLGADKTTPSSYDACLQKDNGGGIVDNVLNVLPISLLFVYRMDLFDRLYKVPIIPYVRAGLTYQVWWYNNGNPYATQHVLSSKPVENTALLSSSGGTWGLVANPGLAFNLTGIDRDAGQNLDALYGINRVNLFVELNYAWVNGFGQTNNLNLSNLGIQGGLGIEF